MEATDPRSQMPEWHRADDAIADEDFLIEPAEAPDGMDALDLTVGRLTATDPFDEIVAATRSETAIPVFDTAEVAFSADEHTIHTRVRSARSWVLPVIAAGSTLLGAGITLALLAGPLGLLRTSEQARPDKAAPAAESLVSKAAPVMTQPLAPKTGAIAQPANGSVNVTSLVSTPPEAGGGSAAASATGTPTADTTPSKPVAKPNGSTLAAKTVAVAPDHSPGEPATHTKPHATKRLRTPKRSAKTSARRRSTTRGKRIGRRRTHKKTKKLRPAAADQWKDPYG